MARTGRTRARSWPTRSAASATASTRAALTLHDASSRSSTTAQCTAANAASSEPST